MEDIFTSKIKNFFRPYCEMVEFVYDGWLIKSLKFITEYFVLSRWAFIQLNKLDTLILQWLCQLI